MAKYSQAKTAEEAEAIPLDRAVQIILDEPGSEVEAAPEVEEKKKPEPKAPKVEAVQPVEEPPPPDISALQKQIESLQKAEQAAQALAESERRRAEEAIRRQADTEAQSTRYQEESAQAQYDAIVNAIEASKAEAETAQRDLEAAEINMDPKLKADSYRRLARSEANLSRLEDGKAAFEARFEAAKNAPKPQPRQQDQFEAAISVLPTVAQNWMRQHPEYITDQNKNKDIQFYHDMVLRIDKKQAFTPEYFESLETHLGMRQPQPAAEEVPVPQPQRNTVVTQAPPTRDVPSASTGRPPSTKVVLSPEQREAARFSGATEIEYARGLQELERRKKAGLLQEGRG